MDAADREFLPAALELLVTPPSPVRLAVIWSICFMVTAALAWAYFGHLEIYAIAQGRIQPAGRSKIVQPLEVGKVIAIAVKNGSKVSAGDVLAVLDATEAIAEKDKQAREYEDARAEAARRRAAIASARAGDGGASSALYPEGTSPEVRIREDSVLAADMAQFFSTKQNLIAQRQERIATRNRFAASIAAREKLIALTKEHADMRVSLNESKAASRAQVIEALQAYQTQLTAQSGEQGQLAENEAAILTIGRKLEEVTAQFVADQTQKLSEAIKKAQGLSGELIKSKARIERATLTAPISGTVQQLTVTTLGQVVSSGQALMTIVPSEAPLEVEALIENQDIGFVEPGQPAVVKIETFPFMRYGPVDGIVTTVSHDAVDESEASSLRDPKSSSRPHSSGTLSDAANSQHLVFPATIMLSKKAIDAGGKSIALSPGMAVQVEILTGRRRVLDYFLGPVRDAIANAAHER
jgi:hemolysin D